jgi:hypothetical protein
VVHLIDSGERERIEKTSIFELPKNLQKIPALATNVSIFGIRPNSNCRSLSCDKTNRNKRLAKSYFDDLTAGGQLLCTFFNFGQPTRVDLKISLVSEKESSVSNLLLKKPFYEKVENSSLMPKEHSLKHLTIDLEKNKIYKVFISHISSDGSFDVVKKG